MLNIDKYIDFNAIWNEEIHLVNDDTNEKYFELLNNFLYEIDNYDGLELIISDCELRYDGELLFVFGENGGQNESDNQGWNRGYDLLFNSNFELINIEYFQG